MDYSCAVIQIITTPANLPALGMVENYKTHARLICFLPILNLSFGICPLEFDGLQLRCDPDHYHSCKLAWLRHGRKKRVPTDVISESLGHQNIAITQAYLKELDNSVLDKAV